LCAYVIPLSISIESYGEIESLESLMGTLVFDLILCGFLVLFVGGMINSFLMEDKSEKRYVKRKNKKRRTDRGSTQSTTTVRPARKSVEPFDYDVAISFAGEDREIAEILANKLRMMGVKVFYDRFYQSNLWGKKLTKHFQEIYGPRTRFVVVLISKYYPIKDWTDFEFSIMRKEAKKRRLEFILPIRLDDTKILGIQRDIGYLDLRIEGIDGVINHLFKKLSR
jgi:hypothetical protein